MTTAPQEWIISDKDYHIALEYFHLEARPAPQPQCPYWGINRIVPNDDNGEYSGFVDSWECCKPNHDTAIAAQARSATLTDVIVILNERAMIDENNQYYLWLEDAECAVESLRTPSSQRSQLP